jgi:hypothetical protein
MRRRLSLISELSGLIAFAAESPGQVSLSMDFPMAGFSTVAIAETFMDCRRSFERSSNKRGNYAPARLKKIRTGNLTFFTPPDLLFVLYAAGSSGIGTFGAASHQSKEQDS